MAILTGLIVLPFLFMKKNQHALSVRTENDYVVMRLDGNNFRQMLNEFEVHKVTVKTVNENADSKNNKKNR
jgi:tRNA(His) 5'-end guanylyltransferase